MSHSPEQRAEIIRLWNETDMTAGAIARELGLRSRNVVIGVCSRSRDKGCDVHRRTTSGGGKPRAARTPKVKPLPPQPAAIETKPVALELRERHQCCWPLWPHQETGAPDFPVCGAD